MPRGTKTVREAPDSEEFSLASLTKLVRTWQADKDAARRLSEQTEKERDQISAAVDSLGEPDDKGNIWLSLGEWVQGYDTKGVLKKFNALQRQRRKRVNLNEERAIDILERKNILDDYSRSYLAVTDPAKAIEALEAAGLLEGHGIEVMTSVGEDEVRAAFFEDKISEDELNEILTVSYTWALYPDRM